MLIQFLAPILAFFSVILVGTGIALFLFGRRSRIRDRLNEGEDVAAWGGGQNIQVPAAKIIEYVGSAVSPGGASSNLRNELVRAGFRQASAPSVFLGIKFILLFAAIIVIVGISAFTSFAMPIKLLFGLVTFGVFFFGPNLATEFFGRRRSNEMRRHLPDMVDLLEVCVSGGMGFDQAWLAVSEEIRSVCPLLGDEMALTNLEVHLGEARGTAIRRMAERTDVKDLSSLVATIVQSEKYGTSIGEALIIFTENLREIRSMRAEAEAEKMSIKMLLPMIVFIFPVQLIVAVGPAVITIIEVFAKMDAR